MTEIVEMEPMASAIEGLLVVTQRQASDERGTVREFFRQSTYTAPAGIAEGVGGWQQINVTESRRGAVRGLHGEAMTKLIACVAGEAFGVYLDARQESSTFGAVVTAELRPGLQVLVPAGVCNGFQALSDCQYLYCFDDEWRPGMEGVAYSPLDDGLGVTWPLPVDDADRAQISEKDAAAPRFSEQFAV